jgi:hypothetical protein
MPFSVELTDTNLGGSENTQNLSGFIFFLKMVSDYNVNILALQMHGIV